MIFEKIIQVKNVNTPKYVFFEIVSTYFYPKAYMTYAEFGRIRGKYPKNQSSTTESLKMPAFFIISDARVASLARQVKIKLW